MKPRQPRQTKEGANLSEQSNNKRIFMSDRSAYEMKRIFYFKKMKEKQRRIKQWKNVYLHRNP